MITNESLFDGFRNARRRGYRNAWHPPAWASTNVTVGKELSRYLAGHGMPEPPEQIFETDMVDHEREQATHMEECSQCGKRDIAMNLTAEWDDSFICYWCDRELKEDHERTMRGVNAYLDYQQFSGLAAQWNSSRF